LIGTSPKRIKAAAEALKIKPPLTLNLVVYYDDCQAERIRAELQRGKA
jgi:hypothetical protein